MTKINDHMSLARRVPDGPSKKGNVSGMTASEMNMARGKGSVRKLDLTPLFRNENESTVEEVPKDSLRSDIIERYRDHIVGRELFGDTQFEMAEKFGDTYRLTTEEREEARRSVYKELSKKLVLEDQLRAANMARYYKFEKNKIIGPALMAYALGLEEIEKKEDKNDYIVGCVFHILALTAKTYRLGKDKERYPATRAYKIFMGKGEDDPRAYKIATTIGREHLDRKRQKSAAVPNLGKSLDFDFVTYGDLSGPKSIIEKNELEREDLNAAALKIIKRRKGEIEKFILMVKKLGDEIFGDEESDQLLKNFLLSLSSNRK